MKLKRLLRCTEPLAPVVKCAVCGNDVHTCENPSGWTDKRCPAHPEGCEMRDGSWVCCDRRYSIRAIELEARK